MTYVTENKEENSPKHAEVEILFTTQKRVIIKASGDKKFLEIMMTLEVFAQAMSGAMVKGIDIDTSDYAEVMITSITNGLYMVKIELERGTLLEVNLKPEEFAKAVTGSLAVGHLV
ncbi:hypothetical protein [Vibrio owensii]|uniref:hypothetical protein n=1 Tax=Vibrio harveyi group TaxID=717610 RepID=UPI003CC639E6